MSVTWRGAPEPPLAPIPWTGRARAALRLALLVPTMGAALAVFGLVRLVERALRGARRPWSPVVRQRACRALLAIAGLRRRAEGRPLAGRGALVANHASWLDILALNASAPVTFVSKAEVRGWPFLGWVAALAGTVFITRRRGDAVAQQALLRARLAAGDTLAFFPEGTSTDGRRVLPFKSTLFATFLAPGLEGARIQPVTIAYSAPEGARPDLYAWWGAMALLPHVLRVLAAPRGGEVAVIHHPPIAVGERCERKALARRAEAAVREGLEARLRVSPRAR